jgi:hypothetical protein
MNSHSEGNGYHGLIFIFVFSLGLEQRLDVLVRAVSLNLFLLGQRRS